MDKELASDFEQHCQSLLNLFNDLTYIDENGEYRYQKNITEADVSQFKKVLVATENLLNEAENNFQEGQKMQEKFLAREKKFRKEILDFEKEVGVPIESEWLRRMFGI